MCFAAYTKGTKALLRAILAAAGAYRRLAEFKDPPVTPTLEEVLAALHQNEPKKDVVSYG